MKREIPEQFKIQSNNCRNRGKTDTEAVNRIRIDNTMAKRKSTKWQAMIYTTLHKKQQQKIEQH